MTISVEVVGGYNYESKTVGYCPTVVIQSLAYEQLDPRKLLKLQTKIENVIRDGLAECRIKDGREE